MADHPPPGKRRRPPVGDESVACAQAMVRGGPAPRLIRLLPGGRVCQFQSAVAVNGTGLLDPVAVSTHSSRGCCAPARDRPGLLKAGRE